MPSDEFTRLIGRRRALQLIGMTLVAVACGPADTTDQDSAGDDDSGGDSGSEDRSRADAGTGGDGSGSAGDESTAADDEGTHDPIPETGPEYDADGALQTVSSRSHMMPPEMIAELAAVYSGVWLGAWADSNGDSGTVDANVGFDADSSSLEIAVAATGPILGSDGLAPTSVAVPLGGDFFEFEERDPLGYMYVSNQGDEHEVISLHDPPAAPNVETLMIDLDYGPDGSAIAAYQAFLEDGQVITGSIVLSLGSDRPPVPSV